MSKQTKPAKSNDDDAFVSDAAVSSGAASYFKPQDGENKIRFISKPILGWIAWEEDEDGKKKPVRTQIDDEPEDQSDGENKPKKFMAAVIIDLSDDSVKIWEITQQSVIKAIKALSSNKDWGNPFSYDITVTRTGKDLKTKYQVTPSPKKPLNKALVKEALEKPCNLDALYEGKDPWSEIEDEQTEYHFK